MKAFWLYTLARFGVLVGTYLVVWLVAQIWFDPAPLNLFVLVVSFVISAFVSYVALGRLREELALHLHNRASRLSARIEESRSAEDVD